MEIFIIFGLIFLNGLFSLAEISLVSSRKFKLELLQKKGKKSAQTALELQADPTKFLSTVQIGITLIGILLGVYSGKSLTADIKAFLDTLPYVSNYSQFLASTTIVVLITFFSILFGELLPKRIGLTAPETFATGLAKLMYWTAKITSPFVWLLTKSNDVILKLFRIKPNLESKVSEEEIKSIIQESTQGGEIQEIEQDIVERVFDLGDLTVESLMTHHSDIVWFDVNESLSQIKEKAREELHSAYPVCDGSLNQVVGVVLLKELSVVENGRNFKLKDYLKTPIYVPETVPAYTLLAEFKKAKIHYAVVIDEYGGTVGFLTMDDILDALVGDVSEEAHDEYGIQERSDNSWFADAQFSFFEFLKYFDIEYEREGLNSFQTIGGLVIHQLKAVPRVGDKTVFEGYEIEVIDMDGQRMDKLLITKLYNSNEEEELL